MTAGGREGRARPRRRRRDAAGERPAGRRAPTEQPFPDHPSPDPASFHGPAADRPPAPPHPPAGFAAPGRPFPGPPAEHPPPPGRTRPGGRPGARATGRVRSTAGRWFTDHPPTGMPGGAPAEGPPQPPPPGPPHPAPGEPAPAPAARRATAKRTKRRRSSWSFRLPALGGWELSERRQRVIIGISGGMAILAIAIVLTLMVARLAELAEPPRATAGDTSRIDMPRPDDYQAWASLPQFAPIADRENDPAPLTAREIFSARTLKNGEITLRLVERKEDRDCSAALWGDDLIAHLAKTGCTQAVRGLYRSADGRYVAQYTLFNLATVGAADEFVKRLTVMHRGGWVRPLESTAAAFPAGGHTEASGHAMGHLAALVWIARADGAEPTARDDFVGLSLAVRGVEKAVFARVVAAGEKSGTPPK